MLNTKTSKKRVFTFQSAAKVLLTSPNRVILWEATNSEDDSTAGKRDFLRKPLKGLLKVMIECRRAILHLATAPSRLDAADPLAANQERQKLETKLIYP
jgi:hypothetical protein